jgi:hypothetical protein
MLRYLLNIQLAACLTMAGGNAVGCKPAVAGAKDRLYLIPLDAIAGVVRSALPGKEKYVSITLKTGTKAFLFEGQNNSNVARAQMKRGKYAPQYIHEIDLVAFGISPEEIRSLEALNVTRVVAVLEDNNGYMKVYGLNAGLLTSKNDSDSANADTGGANEGTLSSDKESGYADYLVPDGAAVTASSPYDVQDARDLADTFLVAQP